MTQSSVVRGRGRGYYQVFQKCRVGRSQAILFAWAAPGRDASSAGAAAAAAVPGADAARAPAAASTAAAADSAADADPPPTAPTQIATVPTLVPARTLPEFPTVIGAAEVPQRPIHGGNDGSLAARTQARERPQRRQVPGDGDNGAGWEDAREAAADEAEADVAEGGEAEESIAAERAATAAGAARAAAAEAEPPPPLQLPQPPPPLVSLEDLEAAPAAAPAQDVDGAARIQPGLRPKVSRCLCLAYCRSYHAAGKCPRDVLDDESNYCDTCRCRGMDAAEAEETGSGAAAAAAAPRRCSAGRIQGSPYCFCCQWQSLPLLHRVIRAWGRGGLLEKMMPVDLEILLVPEHLRILSGRPWLQFLVYRAKEPGPVTAMLQLAPPCKTKVTPLLILRLLHDTIEAAAGKYDKTTGAILHTGSRVLGFLNLVVQCRAAVAVEEAAGASASTSAGQRQRQRQQKGQAVAASPQSQSQKLIIGASAEAKWALKSDDLSVLEALLAASDRHGPAIAAARNAAEHLAAFEGVLDELPGCLKTGQGSTMARPHVLRKHLLVQDALAPGTVKWKKMSWDDCRRAFPDVGMHVLRETIPVGYNRPSKLACHLHVDIKFMSMFMCLVHEVLRPLVADYGADVVESLFCGQVPALVALRDSFREKNGSNPSPAILARQAVAAAGLQKLPAEDKGRATSGTPPLRRAASGGAGSASYREPARDWRQLLRRKTADEEEGLGAASCEVQGPPPPPPPPAPGHGGAGTGASLPPQRRPLARWRQLPYFVQLARGQHRRHHGAAAPALQSAPAAPAMAEAASSAAPAPAPGRRLWTKTPAAAAAAAALRPAPAPAGRDSRSSHSRK